MQMEIANRLYEYRKAADLSQEDVAERIGVSRQAVSKWECGESSPDTENLIALAQLYHVSVDELLFADPEEPVEPAADTTAEEAAAQEEMNAAFAAAATALGAFADNAEGTIEAIAESVGGNTSGQATEDFKAKEGDYANISLENGVHVRDSETGEEVHVGWDGIHIDTDKDEHIHIDFKAIARAIRAARKGLK